MGDNQYMNKPILFKIQKVARYIRLYGLGRTAIKIYGQYHMNKNDDFDGPRWNNPGCSTPSHEERLVSIIGCGNFAYSNIAYYLKKKYSRHFLRGAFDTDKARSLSIVKAYRGAYCVDDPQAVIEDPGTRLIYIASNHASHAEYAVQAMEAGKDVHIEKPHVVSEEQLERLIKAKQRNPEAKVFLGFNRPHSKHFNKIMAHYQKETGPAMINWFIAGHEIEDNHWYFSEEEGGRIMGNLCHWTDLTLHMVNRENAFPCQIIPCSQINAKSDFATSILFADGSIAVLSFSAKGHTFEGVREILHAHRGDSLLEIKDFASSKADVVEKVYKYNSFYRDHGHSANILNSVDGSIRGIHSSVPDFSYVIDTARLYLAVAKAHKERKPVMLKNLAEM